jgi:hypothetical protein
MCDFERNDPTEHAALWWALALGAALVFGAAFAGGCDTTPLPQPPASVSVVHPLDMSRCPRRLPTVAALAKCMGY